MYYLGVDGGGTKTEFTIIDVMGRVLGKAVLSTSHYMQVGIKKTEEILKKGIFKVLKKSGLKLSDLSYSFFGLPGYGVNKVKDDEIKIIIQEILKNNNFSCENDSIAAWAGSLRAKPGIHIISGTGSIVLSVDRNYNQRVAGGWGWLLGDEGSAHWITKKMLTVFSKQSDGRMDKTILYKLIKEELEIYDDFKIIDLIRTNNNREFIASLAKINYDAALKGDIIAKYIYMEAARELSECVKAVLSKSDFIGYKQIEVSYSGGVFKSRDFILKPLKNYLSTIDKRLIIKEPLFDPSIGAAIYARDKDLNIDFENYKLDA